LRGLRSSSTVPSSNRRVSRYGCEFEFCSALIASCPPATEGSSCCKRCCLSGHGCYHPAAGKKFPKAFVARTKDLDNRDFFVYYSIRWVAFVVWHFRMNMSMRRWLREEGKAGEPARSTAGGLPLLRRRQHRDFGSPITSLDGRHHQAWGTGQRSALCSPTLS